MSLFTKVELENTDSGIRVLFDGTLWGWLIESTNKTWGITKTGSKDARAIRDIKSKLEAMLLISKIAAEIKTQETT